MRTFVVLTLLSSLLGSVALAHGGGHSSKASATQSVELTAETASYAIGRLEGGRAKNRFDDLILKDLVKGYHKGYKKPLPQVEYAKLNQKLLDFANRNKPLKSGAKKADVISPKEASYFMGLQQGTRVESGFDKSIVNKDFIKGFKQAYKEGVESRELAELNRQVRVYYQAYQSQKSVEFLKANAKRKGVVVTDSGLQYEVVKEGKGEQPKPSDRVKVHFTGKLADGTSFDDTRGRGSPSSFIVKNAVKGLIEGLQLMRPGAIYKFYIPEELAHVTRGMTPRPGTRQAMIYEMELLEIVAEAEAKPAVSKAKVPSQEK